MSIEGTTMSVETGTNYCVGFVPIVRLNFSHDLK
jgi:hypothetical protein